MITREIFDLLCALKFVAVARSSSSVISLNHLGERIKRSYLLIYGELVSREVSFQFSRECLTPSKRDRVFSAVEHLCGDLKTFSRVKSFGKRIISFREARIAFGEGII